MVRCGAREQARLANRLRQRAIGAGARRRLVFVDRLLATLVHLRHGVTDDVVAAWFGVHRSIMRVTCEIRPLLAERGCAIKGGVRLRLLADVPAYLDAVTTPLRARPGREEDPQSVLVALGLPAACD